MAKAMSIEISARLWPCEICESVGAGGMGEVYRALDPLIGREVAAKSLPPAVAGDESRLARFDRVYARIIDLLRTGRDPHSPLAQAVASRGYHPVRFEEMPYPLEGI